MIRFPLLAAAIAVAVAVAPVPARAAPGDRPTKSSEPERSEQADESEQAEEPEQAEESEQSEQAEESEQSERPEQSERLDEPEEPEESDQSGDDEPGSAESPGEPVADLPPEDLQTFADATLDATPLHFAFNAFGDVSILGKAPAAGEDSATFSLGTFALLINGQLSKTLLGTAEMAFDARENNEQDVTLERLHLSWQTERFFVVGGRTHADLGYWNTAFHHGAWLHLPIARPRVLRGEDSGGVLPIHWIGVEGGVRIPAGPGTLSVAGGLGNGRGQDEEHIPLRRDTNNFKAIKAKIEYLGLGWPDLRIGIGALYDPIAPESMDVRPALPDARIDEYIGNAYAAYRGAQLTLIAEAYSIWHRALVDTFITTDAFVVAGYRFGRLTPYVQLERTDARGETDPFYTPVPDMPTPSTPIDQSELLLGARIDPSVWSALKLEYHLTRADDAEGPDHSLSINWSFGI